MAKESAKTVKKPRKLKTMRELAAEKPASKRKSSSKKSKLLRPFKKAHTVGKKEYHPIKLPDNRFGRILGKRINFIPKYFRESWREIRQVSWPGRRETIRLTIAVFIFSAVFATIVASLDFVLDKVFRNLIVG